MGPETFWPKVQSALAEWLPHGFGNGGSPIRWSEYAPLEFFLGLVLIVGVVLVVCGVLGLAHALALRLTARRVEALAIGPRSAKLEAQKQGLIWAFRASPRLSRLGRNYADGLQMVRGGPGGDRLVALRPAAELLPADMLAAEANRMRSDRLLGTIVGLGAIVILIELAVGALRLHAQLTNADGAHGIDALLDPAMSGAIFALGCVLLTAVSVGAHRLILRLVHANIAKLQTTVDELFYRPGVGVPADGPKFGWPVSGKEAAPLPEPAPSRSRREALIPERAAPAVTFDRPEPAVEPIRETAAAERDRSLAGFEATAQDIHRLIARLSEGSAAQQDKLGEILTRVTEPQAEVPGASEMAQIRESTAELVLLADATRESIGQLATITATLSRVVASLVARADGVIASAAPPPQSTAPAVLGELRELLQEIDEADIPKPEALDVETASRG